MATIGTRGSLGLIDINMKVELNITPTDQTQDTDVIRVVNKPDQTTTDLQDHTALQRLTAIADRVRHVGDNQTLQTF